MSHVELRSHAWPDEKNRYPAFVWRNASADLFALIHCIGGQGSDAELAFTIRGALTDPGDGAPAERARSLVEQAQAAALSRCGPAFEAFGFMAAVALHARRAAIAHVGSVRAHHVRASAVHCITRNPTWHECLLRQLEHPDEQLPWVFAALGAAEGFAVGNVELELAPEELIVLVSRGIEDRLGVERIAARARAAHAPSELGQVLARTHRWTAREAGAFAFAR